MLIWTATEPGLFRSTFRLGRQTRWDATIERLALIFRRMWIATESHVKARSSLCAIRGGVGCRGLFSPARFKWLFEQVRTCTVMVNLKGALFEGLSTKCNDEQSSQLSGGPEPLLPGRIERSVDPACNK